MFQFRLVVLALYIPLHSSGLNVLKPGRIDGNQYRLVSLYSFLFVLFVLAFVLVPHRL